jgi:aspartyl-tRNA synthetase
MRILTKEINAKLDQEVELAGWVAGRRDHGKIIFIDLRDRGGLAQLVFGPKTEAEVYRLGESLRPEWVIRIKGEVKKRPVGMENPELETGQYEVAVKEIQILNRSDPPPFPLETDGYEISEETRLKYRYLDLRRPRLQRNIKLRSEFTRRVRDFLFSHDFVEIETPLLTKSTPEGARDFIVPSRLHPGKFFALPQSPQQYKQLLMVAGFERYFQIARAIRDEDLRADRGFEHTQIDLEMSFVTREEVMALDEAMIIAVVESFGYQIKTKPFPVFSYQEAKEKFGSDRFDLRSEEEKAKGVLAFAWVVDFPFFEKDEKGEWTPTHNPFSAPKEEHLEWLLEGENIGAIVANQYDLVCNGYEVGGGSIRSHQPEVLKAVFRIIGYKDEEIERQFGHLLEAFRYGVPPHGGLAHGIERLLMTMTGETYLREVQAFPQTSSGRTSVMDAPSEIDEKQLAELHLRVIEPKSDSKKN